MKRNKLSQVLGLFGLIAAAIFLFQQPPVKEQTVQVAHAATGCKLGIVVFYDISGSMDFTLSDGTPRYVAAENSILGMYDKIAAFNNGSKILYTEAFHSNGDGTPPVFYNFPGVAIDTTNPGDRAAYKQYLDKISPTSVDYTSKVAGGTPTASALKQIADMPSFSGVDSDTIPVAIIVTDGVPEHNLANEFTGIGTNIRIKDNNGNFLDPSQVQAANPGVNVSSVVDMMNQSLRYKSLNMVSGSTAVPATYGLAVGANGQRSWNPDIVDYFASMNNSDTSNRTFTPDTSQQFYDSLTSIANTACAVTPSLTIKLPPSSIFTPQSLSFANQQYSFSNGNFNPTNQGKITVTTTPYTVSGYNAYAIKIQGFAKGNKVALNSKFSPPNKLVASIVKTAKAQVPPASSWFWISKYITSSPINYRMTFVNPSLTAAKTIANAMIANPSLGTDDLFLSTQPGCLDKNYVAGTYLCARTTVSVVTPEYPVPVIKYLYQSINALPAGITINGNVAAGNSISGFNFASPKSVAVGGTVSAAGAQSVGGYLPASQLSWANINQSLNNIFNQRIKGTTVSNLTTFSSPTWTLNSSSSTDPSDSTTSSFSTTPEGKLWNIDNGSTGGLVFNMSNGLTFSGRGTIVVNGDVTFKGTGPISCANGDFGIIASGSITFQDSVGPIKCGAYVAMGNTSAGNIVFKQSVTTNQAWNLIMVAKNNVTLPNVSANVSINYDAGFANNPTVLFTDILSIVFVSGT